MKGIEMKQREQIKPEPPSTTGEDWEHTIVGGGVYHQKAVESLSGDILYLWHCPCGAIIVKTIETSFYYRGELKNYGAWKICLNGHINTLYKPNGDVVWYNDEVKAWPYDLHDVKEVTQ